MQHENKIEISDRVTLFTRGRSRTYVARFWQGNQTRKISMKTSNQAVARAKALKLAAALVDGSEPHPQAAKQPQTLLEQVVQRFVDYKRRVERRKPKTLVKYDGILSEFSRWQADRSRLYAEDLSSKHLRAYEVEYAQSHEPKTTHCAMCVIKQFGAWLGPHGQGLLDRNPFEGMRLPKPRPRPKFFPKPEQIQNIIARAAGQRRIQLVTLACTGMRVDEMIQLRPQDVDLNGGFIHIVARGEWTPKTHDGRKIPIHPQLALELANMPRGKRQFFFSGEANPATRRASHKVNDRTLLKYMQSIAEKLGIPVMRANGGIVIHSFRDFFETTCVDNGVPQFVVDLWMGHSSGRSQGQTYYGLRDDKSKAWMAKVAFELDATTVSQIANVDES